MKAHKLTLMLSPKMPKMLEYQISEAFHTMAPQVPQNVSPRDAISPCLQLYNNQITAQL